MCLIHMCATGWRRLIGSSELQIIFHKRATEHRSLWQKMTYKDKGSCESSPPCILRIKYLYHIHAYVCVHDAHTHICLIRHIHAKQHTYVGDIHVFMHHVLILHTYVLVGEDSQDPLSCTSFSTKEPLNIGHFCRKWPIKNGIYVSYMMHHVCMIYASDSHITYTHRYAYMMHTYVFHMHYTLISHTCKTAHMCITYS